jgi:hypothetical protein
MCWTELAGEGERERLFGVDVELGAEAPAHIGGDDAKLRVGYAAHEGEYVLHEVGDLGRGVDGSGAGGRFGVHHDGARLDGARDQALLDVAPLDDDVGFIEGFVDVPRAQGPGVALVRSQVLVYERRTFFERRLDVNHCRERLVVYAYKLEGILGLVAVGREHDGDAVARVVHLSTRQRPVVRDLDVLRHRPAAGDTERPLIGQVLAGKDLDHPGPLLRGRDI